ncbi:MAG: shikimate kinase [Clostridia bacterium]
MKHYGLIGQSLTHSHSKTLHELLGAQSYELWPMPPEALELFLRKRAFDGINVTIPYKQAVLPYLDALGETAKRIGCVNTVVKRADGTLFGDNTDAAGFAELARRAGICFANQKTLVLGSGGTSLTVCDGVREAGGVPIVISRKGENSYEQLQRHADAAFLVNTTPVGMYPNMQASAVDLTCLPKLRGVLDVIYNPLRTRLLQQAQALHIPCAGGLAMLVYQAARARELFTGEPMDPKCVQQAERTLRMAATNLVLVGMPGCGKSTVGALLAQKLQMPLADVDGEVEKEAGKSIPALFETEGEAGFRERETAQIMRFAASGGQVLVTGGGALNRAQNAECLRANGFVVHITRDLSQLPMVGRPLSASREALERLWQEREPRYAACADLTVANEKTPEACARAIAEGYYEALGA